MALSSLEASRLAIEKLPKSSQVTTHRSRPQLSPLTSLAAGAVAGGVEAAATYPFEFAKTRAQLVGGPRQSANPFSTIVHIARHDGFRQIYVGCSTLILGTAVKAGVRFLCFDSFKRLFADDAGRVSPVGGVLAGMAAGTFESVLAVTPTERLKTALIDDAKGPKRFRGGGHAFLVLVREQGIAGLYRGLLPTVLKQSATSAVRMGSYNVLKDYAKQQRLPENSLLTFAIGATAGVVTVYATQPLDTIKTRCQGVTRLNSTRAIAQIFATSGLRGFWSGSTMRLGRLVFSGGIVFTVYENVAAVLNRGVLL